MNLPVLVEQTALVAAYLSQLGMLLVHLLLLGLELLALRPLVGSILPYKAETAVHLRQALGREDEHELVLYAAVACHVAHGADEAGTPFAQLRLKGGELSLQDADVRVQSLDVGGDVVYRPLVLTDFRIKPDNLLQTAVDILLLYLHFFLVF